MATNTLAEISAMNDRAEATRQLVAYYLSATESDRLTIRKGYPFGATWVWPHHETIACITDGEPEPLEKIRWEVIHLSLFDWPDYRDLLIDVALLYRALELIGEDADRRMIEFSDLASPVVASHLYRFTFRSKTDKSAAAFGWSERQTGRGVELVSRLGG